MPEPRSLISSTALSFSSQTRLLSMSCFRLMSCEYRCLMPSCLALTQSLASCACMLSMFIDCVSARCRVRAVVLPEGSPIWTVPAPSCSTLTCCCCTRPWAAHQAHGVVAMEVHPVERHEGEQVADMERRGGRVHANICADALLCEEPVEGRASTVCAC
jgi:hypothetical protein